MWFTNGSHLEGINLAGAKLLVMQQRRAGVGQRRREVRSAAADRQCRQDLVRRAAQIPNATQVLILVQSGSCNVL